MLARVPIQGAQAATRGAAASSILVSNRATRRRATSAEPAPHVRDRRAGASWGAAADSAAVQARWAALSCDVGDGVAAAASARYLLLLTFRCDRARLQAERTAMARAVRGGTGRVARRLRGVPFRGHVAGHRERRARDSGVMERRGADLARDNSAAGREDVVFRERVDDAGRPPTASPRRRRRGRGSGRRGTIRGSALRFPCLRPRRRRPSRWGRGLLSV